MVCFLFVTGWAQPNNSPAPVVSPEVHQDRQVTFRIRAPLADSVKLSSTDIPGSMFGTHMSRKENGVWELTTKPLVPGAYRYNFNVDGVPVIDRAIQLSASLTNMYGAFLWCRAIP